MIDVAVLSDQPPDFAFSVRVMKVLFRSSSLSRVHPFLSRYPYPNFLSVEQLSQMAQSPFAPVSSEGKNAILCQIPITWHIINKKPKGVKWSAVPLPCSTFFLKPCLKPEAWLAGWLGLRPGWIAQRGERMDKRTNKLDGKSPHSAIDVWEGASGASRDAPRFGLKSNSVSNARKKLEKAHKN